MTNPRPLVGCRLSAVAACCCVPGDPSAAPLAGVSPLLLVLLLLLLPLLLLLLLLLPPLGWALAFLLPDDPLGVSGDAATARRSDAASTGEPPGVFGATRALPSACLLGVLGRSSCVSSTWSTAADEQEEDEEAGAGADAGAGAGCGRPLLSASAALASAAVAAENSPIDVRKWSSSKARHGRAPIQLIQA